jgi:hypothetical protein
LNLGKKAISAVTSAALLASLVATAIAPSAFAAAETLTWTPAASNIASGATASFTVSATLSAAQTVTFVSSQAGGTFSPATIVAATTALAGTVTYTPPVNAGATVRTDTISLTGTADTFAATAVVHVAPALSSISTNGFLMATPATATANGTSVVSISVNPNSQTLGVLHDFVQLNTNVGTFAAVSDALLWGTPAITALTVSGTSVSATGKTTVTLVAPSAVSTAIVQLYDAGVLLDTLTIPFSASSTTGAYISVTAPTPASIGSALNSGPSAMTATVFNSSNVAQANQIVVATASLGYLLTNGAGYCVNSATANSALAASSCIEVTNTLGQATVDLFGGGVGGTSTVTFTSGTLTTSTTVTLGGTFSKLVINQLAYSLATSGALTTVAVVTPEDAAGNVIQLDNAAGAFSTAVSSGIFTAAPFVNGAAYSPDVVAVGATAGLSGYAGYPLTLTCGPNAGTSTITVSATDDYVVPNTTITGTLTVSCAGAAASFTITPSATSVAQGGSLTLAVKALDSAGNPAPDSTTVSMFGNNVGTVIPTSGTAQPINTSAGSASFTFLAPNYSGVATLTAFVSGITASKSVTITVGTGVTPPSSGGASHAASALGITTSGSFTTATKLPVKGKYVTIKFYGLTAGQSVIVMAASKSGTTWSAFAPKSTRIANASGVVYYYYRSTSAAWLSFMVSGGNSVQARWR